MKTSHKLALCALLTPLTLGASSVYAQATTTPDRAQDQRVTEDTQRPGTTQPGAPQPSAAQPSTTQPGTAQPRTDTMDRSAMTAGKKYLTRAPANGVHADWLIGQDVKSQVDDQDVGSISDLLISENGEILALIVGVGGFLGVGEKEVAISWDAVQHTRDQSGDARLTTNMTKDSLRDAPEYDRKVN